MIRVQKYLICMSFLTAVSKLVALSAGFFLQSLYIAHKPFGKSIVLYYISEARFSFLLLSEVK